MKIYIELISWMFSLNVILIKVVIMLNETVMSNPEPGLFICLFICLFVCLFICLFVYLFACCFVCLSVCVFIGMFVSLFIIIQGKIEISNSINGISNK